MGLFGQQEPEAIEVQGKPLRCQVCHNDKFWQKRAELHSAVASFFNIDGATPTCICLICSSCGYIHWFFPEN